MANAGTGTQRLGLAALSGLFAGAAAACKYPALVFVALPLGLWLIVVQVVWNRQTWQRCALAAVVFAISALAAGGLWFAKNAVLAGNPTYPLLVNVFGGETRTPERDEQWHTAHRVPNYQLGDLLERGKRTALSSEWLSPVIVPLLLAWLMLRDYRRTSHAEMLLVALLVFVWLAWWLLTHRLDRFLTPLLPIAALLAGAGAVLLPSITARALVALAVAYGALLVPAGLLGDNRLLADLTQLADNPLHADSAHQYLNAHADQVTGVLLVGDSQPFDLRMPVWYNTCFDENIFELLARDRTPAQLATELGRRKISHVLVDWGEINRYRSPGNYGFTPFIKPMLFINLQRAGVIIPVESVSTDRRTLYSVLPH